MSSSYLDLTSMNAALKELYSDQVVQNMVYKKNPFLAMIKKNEDFGGKYKPIPIISGVSQGRSATFTNAQGNQSPVQIESFLLTRNQDYSIATIDNQTMLASKTDKMAFLEGSRVVIDGAIRSIQLSLASAMYRSGTGSIGQIASGGITSGVITLQNALQVVNFEVNMVLQANATDGGATPRAALGYVIAVNRQAGTVTVSATSGGTAGNPASWQGTDYLLVQGDNNLKITGLAGWLPSTAPTSTDSFFGVNRSADVVRLSGYYTNGSSESIEEALIDSQTNIALQGGSPDTCFINYTSFGALKKALGAKVEYIDLKGPGEISFRGIMLHGDDGEIKVIPDRNCQATTAWMLQMDTMALESLGPAPQILKYGDGLEMLRVYNADAGEVRVGYYAQLACNAPGWNGQVALQV